MQAAATRGQCHPLLPHPTAHEPSLLVPCAVLEVHQFSRDASVAEAWLLGQEPYLSSREIGQSVDEVEKLIKRHEAFEKSAATWDERFSALERLTTVSGRWTPDTRPLRSYRQPLLSACLLDQGIHITTLFSSWNGWLSWHSTWVTVQGSQPLSHILGILILDHLS